MERLPIGVPDLDQTVMGGLVKGSLCTLLGPPGAGKSILGKRFIYTGIQDGRNAFLVSTSEDEQGAMETMKVFNWAKGLQGKLHFLDCYSWRQGGSVSKYSAQPSALTDVSVVLTRMLEDHKVVPKDSARIVLDSFTDFIKYAGSERALRLLDSLRTKLRSRAVTGLVLLEEGVHDERTVSSLEYSTDGTIRMKITDQGRFMMVSRMMATPVAPKWIPYAIGR